MKRYRLGNRKNEKEIYTEEVKALSMKDIDKIANNRIDSLLYMFERSRIMDYMILTDSRRRMFAINFIAGIGKGFGQAIGFSFLTGLVLYIVSKWVNLPIIGEYIAEFLDMVDNFRGR